MATRVARGAETPPEPRFFGQKGCESGGLPLEVNQKNETKTMA
jgi:hypothetical protein